jgi:hypothetical protein
MANRAQSSPGLRPGALRALAGAALPLLLVAAALLAPCAEAALTAPPSHSFLFELRGFIKEPGHIPMPPPEGEFEDACGVAVDSAGDIYLADYYHHVIDVYNAGREYLTQIADPDPDGPCNLAVDAAGSLYVNHWHRDVVRYIPSEFPPTAATDYGSPTVIDSARSTGVAIDPATGNVYVDDRTYIAVYEPSGNPVEVGGAPLRIGLDPFASYYGVAVSDFGATEGDVYLADAANDTVRVYAPAEPESPVQVIDGAGTPQHGFHSLADSNVAIDQADGHLYVVDDLEPGFEAPAAVFDEFNSAGAYRGQLPGSFIDAEPSALAVDGAGNVYATDGNTEQASLEAFAPTLAAHTLEVSKTGAGEGTVTSEPAGINCGSACAAEYNSGSEVILTAVPAPGSAFAGFGGGSCAGTAPRHPTLGSDTAVSAEFTPLPPGAAALRGAAQVGATSLDPAPSTLKLSAPRGSGLTLTILASLPAAGTLSARGAGLRRSSASAAAPGPLRLRLRLNRAGARALRAVKIGHLAVRTTFTFTPVNGPPLATRRTVRFRQRGQQR